MCTPKTAKIEKSEDQAYQEFKAKAHDGKAFGEKFNPKGAMAYIFNNSTSSDKVIAVMSRNFKLRIANV